VHEEAARQAALQPRQDLLALVDAELEEAGA